MEENKEKTVKKRQECDPAYQWHIQDLYASDEAWEKDYESLTSEIQSLAAYEGRLKEGSEVFVEYMRKKEALMKKFEAIYVYANQRYHEDTGNSFYQGLAGKAQTLSIQLDSAVVFEEPELLAIGQGCCLHGNNCIGNDGKSGGAPVIGKNVDIGFGAVIIGDIQIADNCKIGAGAVVVHSCLEEGSTLVGVPARRV